jgi:hypothetical protein
MFELGEGLTYLRKSGSIFVIGMELAELAYRPQNIGP